MAIEVKDRCEDLTCFFCGRKGLRREKRSQEKFVDIHGKLLWAVDCESEFLFCECGQYVSRGGLGGQDSTGYGPNSWLPPSNLAFWTEEIAVKWIQWQDYLTDVYDALGCYTGTQANDRKREVREAVDKWRRLYVQAPWWKRLSRFLRGLAWQK